MGGIWRDSGCLPWQPALAPFFEQSLGVDLSPRTQEAVEPRASRQACGGDHDGRPEPVHLGAWDPLPPFQAMQQPFLAGPPDRRATLPKQASVEEGSLDQADIEASGLQFATAAFRIHLSS